MQAGDGRRVIGWFVAGYSQRANVKREAGADGQVGRWGMARRGVMARVQLSAVTLSRPSDKRKECFWQAQSRENTSQPFSRSLGRGLQAHAGGVERGQMRASGVLIG
jgi:hypothetical protein